MPLPVIIPDFLEGGSRLPRFSAENRDPSFALGWKQENRKVGDWSIFRPKDAAMALDRCPKTWTCTPCV